MSHTGESQPVDRAVPSVTGFTPDAAMWRAALAGRSGRSATVTIERSVFFHGDLTEGPAGWTLGVRP